VLDPFLKSLVGGLEDLSAAQPPTPVSYQYTMSGLIDQLGQTLGAVANVVGPIVSAITSLVFMLLISFHLSLSGQKMLAGFPKLLPPAYVPEVTGLFERIQDV